VAERLGAFAAAVDGADAAPAPDAEAGVALLEPAARASLAAWEALKAKDLAALNARLTQAGLRSIGVPR
jgi:hypothetical protein